MKKIFTAATLLALLAALSVLSGCNAPAAAEETATAAADAVSAATASAASALDTILAAGTTQAFTDEAVPQEDIEAILRAGLAAESAINQQPWFFAAVTDQDVLTEISASGGNMPAPTQGGASGFGGGSAKAALGDSPLAIIVYQDKSTSSPNPDFDCGLATQNMYLAAVSLGYGAKIVSSPTMTLNGENHDQICEKLGVDPSYTAVAVLLVGMPDQTVDGVTGASVRAGLEGKTTIR